MKLLLEDPRNVRDLLGIARADVLDFIDFDNLQSVKTTFVQRDYRHVETDVVLIAPLRDKRGRRSRRKVLIYILLEHQSEPDRLMPLRMLDYVIQIFKYQQRDWLKTHASLDGIRFAPVLPVVFYTGTRKWPSLGSLVDMVERGELVERFTPAMESLYLNLPAIAPERLEAEGGFFGWVLRLVQQRKAKPNPFRDLLRRVVVALEAMPTDERLRWLELLSYVYAFVYHVRNPSERPSLRETIETSVETDQHRQELFDMGKTIADELKEEGMIERSQQTLIRQLRRRFGEIPDEMVYTIETTRDMAELDLWLDNVVTVNSLEEVGVGGAG